MSNLLRASFVSVSLVSMAPLAAQEEESAVDAAGESVVTARKWRESVEEVPGSVTLIDSAALETAGWDTLRDASLSVPNVNITEFSARRLSFPFVRGIGSGQGDPSVITYIDGVPQFGSGGVNLPLAGVERVEFLRGPQGTLWGRNALGGVMHVITERPGPSLGYGGWESLGNFDQREIGAQVSGPLGEGSPAGFGLLGRFSARDGYTTNDFTGNDVDYRDAFFGRGDLVLAPDADSELRLSLFGERARDGGFVLSELQGLKDEPHTINQDFEGVTERDVISPALTWTRFGSSADFVSISAYETWEVFETSDFDFSPIDGVRRTAEESQDYFYQELRVASAEGAPLRISDDAELRWLVGASGLLSSSDRSAANDFRPGGEGIFFPPGGVGVGQDTGDFDDWALGLFGQATWIQNEDLELTAGLRADHESKEAELTNEFLVGGFPVLSASSDEEESFGEAVPHFSAAYRIDEDLRVYGLAAGGFKAGGFNLNAPAGQLEFDTETSWTYELGVKSQFADEKVRIGAAVFYIDWDDMQLSQFDALAGGYVQNVGESTSQGVELEAEVDLGDHVTLVTALGTTDSEFEDFVDVFGNDVSGNDLPFAPETTWSVGGIYSTPLGEDAHFFVRGDVAMVGDFFYDAGNLEKESYSLTDVRTGLRKGPYGLSLSLNNAFDEEYIPIAFQPSPVDPTVFVGESGAPRTLLVTLSFEG